MHHYSIKLVENIIICAWMIVHVHGVYICSSYDVQISCKLALRGSEHERRRPLQEWERLHGIRSHAYNVPFPWPALYIYRVYSPAIVFNQASLAIDALINIISWLGAICWKPPALQTMHGHKMFIILLSPSCHLLEAKPMVENLQGQC